MSWGGGGRKKERERGLECVSNMSHVSFDANDPSSFHAFSRPTCKLKRRAGLLWHYAAMAFNEGTRGHTPNIYMQTRESHGSGRAGQDPRVSINCINSIHSTKTGGPDTLMNNE